MHIIPASPNSHCSHNECLPAPPKSHPEETSIRPRQRPQLAEAVLCATGFAIIARGLAFIRNRPQTLKCYSPGDHSPLTLTGSRAWNYKGGQLRPA
jgi:hypothetical protein